MPIVTLSNGRKAEVIHGTYADNKINRELGRVGKQYKRLKFISGNGLKQRGGMVGELLQGIISIIPSITEFINNMIKPKKETKEQYEKRIRDSVGYKSWTKLSSGRYALQDPFTNEIYTDNNNEPIIISQNQWLQIKALENNNNPMTGYKQYTGEGVVEEVLNGVKEAGIWLWDNVFKPKQDYSPTEGMTKNGQYIPGRVGGRIKAKRGKGINPNVTDNLVLANNYMDPNNYFGINPTSNDEIDKKMKEIKLPRRKITRHFYEK